MTLTMSHGMSLNRRPESLANIYYRKFFKDDKLLKESHLIRTAFILQELRLISVECHQCCDPKCVNHREYTSQSAKDLVGKAAKAAHSSQ
jgi:hypothetical protein